MLSVLPPVQNRECLPPVLSILSHRCKVSSGFRNPNIFDFFPDLAVAEKPQTGKEKYSIEQLLDKVRTLLWFQARTRRGEGLTPSPVETSPLSLDSLVQIDRPSLSPVWPVSLVDTQTGRAHRLYAIVQATNHTSEPVPCSHLLFCIFRPKNMSTLSNMNWRRSSVRKHWRWTLTT